MNISPREVDASSAPFSQHSSGDLIHRMHGGLPNHQRLPGQPQFEDLKKASGLVSKPAAGGMKQAALDLKKKSLEQERDLTKIDDFDNRFDDVDDEDDDEEASDTEPSERVEAGDAKGGEVKKRRSRKKWKKPKDKPNRPLSAYNLFFQAERAIMLGEDANAHDQDKSKKRVHRKTHGKIGFAEMARNIGQKWKNLPQAGKRPYEERAAKEKKRYATELAAWKLEQKMKNKASKLKALVIPKDDHDKEKGEAESSSQVDPPPVSADAVRLRMLKDGVGNRQNLSLIQQQQAQDLPTMEYIRAMQERQSALLGRSSLDSSVFQYPSAAEASANAILQQFQTMQPMPGAAMKFGGMPYPNNMLAAAELQQQMGAQRQMNLAAAELQQQMGAQRQVNLSAAELQQQMGVQRQMNLAAAELQQQMEAQRLMNLSAAELQQQMGAQRQMNLSAARLQQLHGFGVSNRGEFNMGHGAFNTAAAAASGELNGVPQFPGDMAAAMRRLQNRYNM